ncbi:HYR domain-containing protein [Aequorivita sp. CIP111184]|uniref:HYR domain-containing protein n=1 Tax=Aequorivita sp. CIP111184 TaxID=2211356 RepID=UPI0015EBA52F|nr:HYR domain-containing protein [Aequorivita sp. CIP111184]
MVFLTTLFEVNAQSPDCFINLGLNSWSVEGDPTNGNWVPAPDGSSVLQTVNSNPSFYVSNADYFNTTIQGEFRVETTSDDDFIGFVIGYQSPNTTTPNDEYNFILFDWKQAAQSAGSCTAPAAIRLSRIQGTSTDFISTFWCQNSAINEVLGTNSSLGGWADNTLYTFQVQYGASNISVWINGTLIFDVDGTYTTGRFGFYNFSQEAVRYQNFSLPFSTVINKTDVSCLGASDGTATAVASDFATPPYDYLWDTGATTETIVGLAPGTYSVTVTSQEGCTTTESVNIITTPDTEDPSVSVNSPFSVTLDATGNASISVSDIEVSSSDNCGIASKTLSKTSFDCSNTGTNNINYTVTDNSGNSTVIPVTVTVTDNINPVAQAQDLILQLTDPTGLTITPAMVDNGSTDNCTFTLSLSKTTFDCSDIGTQTVTLTATDASGNVNTTNADITITAPEPFVVTSAGATQMGDISTFTTVDPTIAITYNGNADGALVSISNNFYSGDELALDPGYTIPGGVSVNYNSSTGVFTIIGTLTDTDLETLFQNIQFRTTSGNTSERTIEFIIGGSVSNPDNNHYYEYVNQSLSWVQAKAAAATRTLYGLQGYLATSTSAEENNFIKTKLTDDGWLGGSDEFSQINQAVGSPLYANQAAAENNWYWITGPEAGTQMSFGSNPLPGQYVNWNPSEPNNSGGTEDYMQIYFANDGRWNDLGTGQSMGYIVEYGGLAGDQSCFSFSNNKIVLLNHAPIIDPIANVAGCPGSSFTQNVTISDVEDAVTDLTVTVASNNQTLVQDTNLSVSYDGTNFVVTGTSEAGIQSSAVITVTATDTGGLSTNGSFTFTAEDTEAPIAVCLGSTPIYVGSFRVSDGPSWVTNPPVYNAQETAALIFGGNPSDYAVSIDPNTTDPNTITHTAWTDSWGDGFAINAEGYSLDTGAPGYNDPGDYDTAVSSWVNDHVDLTKVNYVWTAATPLVVQLDGNGQAVLDAADVDGGSTDNCGIASITVSPNNFSCADIGPNTVTLTVTDVNGNSSTCSSTVMVEDNIAPTAICQPITVQLDATGNVSITPADVDGGSSDACGIASTTIDVSSFDCSNIGTNNVVLTVTDNNGNVSTCTAVVTVEDTIAPIIACPANIIANTDLGECSSFAYFTEPFVLDNCSIDTVVQTAGLPSGSQFPVGVNTIEFTATDVNGNVSTCSFTITVIDNEAPVAVCQNITIQLDTAGNAAIVAADVDGGSTDQCGVATISIDMDTFDCSNVGDNNVILTVTDVNGNTSTCTAIVTVEDVTAPVVACQNLTVELDPVTGTVTIAGTDIDNGSTDTCGIASYDLDIDTFDCSNIGDNTVILTVTDVNGNTETCTAIVTVEDNTSPVLVCQDFTLELGADGTATLDLSDVIASNDDACGIFTVAVDITQFSCADIGTPVTVQIFSQDNNGNLATCTAVVTVVDNLAPVVTCPADQTVDPGQGNLFYIVPDYFATGEATAVDNCTDPVTVTTQDPAAGTTLSDGTYTITLTATDAYGNIGTCEFELVVDSVLGTGGNNQSLGSIAMYPNPAKGNVTIGNPQSLELERADIYDLTGRLVQSFNLKGMATAKTLNVDNLAAATYVVIIKGKNGQITKRLLKE